MERARHNRFEAIMDEPPQDEAPFPDRQEPVPDKKPFPLDSRVTEKTIEEFDMFRCPYAPCRGKCNFGRQETDKDNLAITKFTCSKEGHQWMFVRDVVNGEIQEKTGWIKGVGWSGFKMPEEPQIESDDR